MNNEIEDQQNLNQASCKIKLLEVEYDNLKKYCEVIENELSDTKSQIKSMKLALTYSDLFSIIKETDMKEEIERLKKKLNQSIEKKEKKKEKLVKTVKHVDELVVKIQNLHQTAEYYKEDLFKYQDEYTKTKDLLEEEKRNKDIINENYSKLTIKLTDMQTEFKRLTKEIEDYKIETEQRIKKITASVKQEAAKEIDLIRETHQKEKDIFFRDQVAKIQNIEESNSILLENFKNLTAVKIANIKQFYEGRISSLINEISCSEGKYQAELLYYKNIISNLNKEKEEISNLNHFLAENAQEAKEGKLLCEMATKDLVNNCEEKIIQSKVLVEKTNFEMEDLRLRYEETKESIKTEYEKLLRLSIKNKDHEIKRIADTYEYNISKAQKNINENKAKKRKHYEIQIEFLLNKIEILEKEKSNLELKFVEKEKLLN